MPTPNTTKLEPRITSLLERLHAGETDRELLNEAARAIAEMAVKLAPAPLTVDLNTNTASRRDVFVKLSPNQAAILYRLNQSYPDLVPIKDLAAAVWGAVGAERRTDYGVIAVAISDIREKLLTSLGVHIENKRAFGYRLKLGAQKNATL